MSVSSHPIKQTAYIRYTIAAFCLGAALGCDAVKPPDVASKARAEPSSYHRLIDSFDALVKGVKAGDKSIVLKTMESYLMTQADFEVLFPAAVASQLWPKYRDEIAADMRKEANQLLTSRIESGFDTVDCIRVSTVKPKETTRGDLAIMNAMKRPPKMYTIRLRSADAELGLRFNGFVYVNGRWRSLFKAYNHLPNQ